MTASPTKLRDGTWGARIRRGFATREAAEQEFLGARITIRTRAGKEWEAIVSRVVFTTTRGGAATLVATRRPASRPRPSPRPGPRPSRSYRRQPGCEVCGEYDRHDRGLRETGTCGDCHLSLHGNTRWL